MQFTVMPPGTPAPPAPSRRPALARLGKSWRTQVSPGVWDVSRAVTADGEWLFVRAADGTWMAGHLPTTTEVRDGLPSLPACRRYAGTGRALKDLKKLQAAKENRGE